MPRARPLPCRGKGEVFASRSHAPLICASIHAHIIVASYFCVSNACGFSRLVHHSTPENRRERPHRHRSAAVLSVSCHFRPRKSDTKRFGPIALKGLPYMRAHPYMCAYFPRSHYMCVYRTAVRTHINSEALTRTYIHAHITPAFPFKPGSARRAAPPRAANISRAPQPRPRAPCPRGRAPHRPKRRDAPGPPEPLPSPPKNPETPSRTAARDSARTASTEASVSTRTRPHNSPQPKRGRPVSRCAPSRLLVAHDAVVHDLVPPDVPARIARDGEAVALLPVDRVVGGSRLRHGADHLRS